MLIARWQIDARFGHKQTVIDMIAAWAHDIAPKIGWTAEKGRLLTGSIGARGDRRPRMDGRRPRRARKILGDARQDRCPQDLGEPYVVSGSARWEIFRVV